MTTAHQALVELLRARKVNAAAGPTDLASDILTIVRRHTDDQTPRRCADELDRTARELRDALTDRDALTNALTALLAALHVFVGQPTHSAASALERAADDAHELLHDLARTDLPALTRTEAA